MVLDSGVQDPIRHRAGLLAALVPWLLLLLLRAPAGYSPAEGDYAQYLSHARALSEGRPYADIGYIYTRFAVIVGPHAYPPGLPLLIAPFARDHAAAERAGAAVAWLSLAALVVLAALYFARQAPRSVAIAAAAVVPLSAGLLGASFKVGSDLPFAALVWGVFTVADREDPWSWGRVAALGALGAGAILFRTAGIALVPAVLLFAMTDPHRARARAVTVAIIWVAAFFLASVPIPVASSYGVLAFDIARSNSASWFLDSARNALLSVVESFSYPFSVNRWDDIYHLALLMLFAVGMTLWLKRRWRSFLAAFVGPYIVLVLWVRGSESRYMWPLYPLVLFAVLQGAVALAQALRVRVPWRQLAAYAVAALLVISAYLQERRQGPVADLRTIPDVRDLIGYVRDSLSTPATRVAFANPRVLTWETRVPAMPLFDAAPDSVLAELRAQRITHVVLGVVNGSDVNDCSFREAMMGAPHAFALARRTGALATYRFDYSAVPSSAPLPGVAPSRSDPCRTNRSTP